MELSGLLAEWYISYMKFTIANIGLQLINLFLNTFHYYSQSVFEDIDSREEHQNTEQKSTYWIGYFPVRLWSGWMSIERILLTYPEPDDVACYDNSYALNEVSNHVHKCGSYIDVLGVFLLVLSL